MERVVLEATEDGFFAEVREGTAAPGTLLGDGPLLWLDTAPVWRGEAGGVTLTADISGPDETLYIGQEVPLRLSTITYSRGTEVIGTLAFDTPVPVIARRDTFGPDDMPGFVVDAGDAVGQVLASARFVFLGDAGDDLFSAADAPPATYETGHFWGREGADSLTGFNGDDVLRGGVGDDRLSGGRGDDVLFGNRGMDVLSGGRGDDVLTGGLGRDEFLFEDAPTGHDRITDFQIGRDLLIFEAPLDGLEAFEITQSGEDTHLTWSQRGAEIILEDVLADDLSAADFLFV